MLHWLGCFHVDLVTCASCHLSKYPFYTIGYVFRESEMAPHLSLPRNVWFVCTPNEQGRVLLDQRRPPPYLCAGTSGTPARKGIFSGLRIRVMLFKCCMHFLESVVMTTRGLRVFVDRRMDSVCTSYSGVMPVICVCTCVLQ